MLRNAGGFVTAEVVTSFAMSQERFGTRQIVVVQHTQCAALAERMPKRSPEERLRAAVRLLRAASDLPHRDAVRGLLLDLKHGTLREVPTSGSRPAVAPARTLAAIPSAPAAPLSRCLWCTRAYDPKASSRRRRRHTYCGDLCRLAARAGGPARAAYDATSARAGRVDRGPAPTLYEVLRVDVVAGRGLDHLGHRAPFRGGVRWDPGSQPVSRFAPGTPGLFCGPGPRRQGSAGARAPAARCARRGDVPP